MRIWFSFLSMMIVLLGCCAALDFTAFWYEPIPSAPLDPLADYAQRIAAGYTAAQEN